MKANNPPGQRLGKGYQDRLVTCDFSETFSDTFILDVETAEFFNIPPQYVGEEAKFAGTFAGTAWVLVPGQH